MQTLISYPYRDNDKRNLGNDNIMDYEDLHPLLRYVSNTREYNRIFKYIERIATID